MTWPGQFAVITAHNPPGELQQESINDEADRLQVRFLPHWRVIGGSPDFSHAEPGYGIVSDLLQARHLAGECRQLDPASALIYRLSHACLAG